MTNLVVYHLPRGATSFLLNEQIPLDKRGEGFWFQSCQRTIAIFFNHTNLPRLPSGFEMYLGEGAYAFLLRVATGLESQVVGEAEIFGQLKEAWSLFERNSKTELRDLKILFQRLFEDTKDIRTHYLQNLGGSSYGSVIRKSLESVSSGPVSVFGAGQIIQSILPWLKGHQIYLWNRGFERAIRLRESLKTDPRLSKLNVRSFFIGEASEYEAWERSHHVIIGIPPCIDSDKKRIEWAKIHTTGKIYHLGAERSELLHWDREFGNRLFALDDLYAEIEKSQANREQSIQRARNACWERAKLRTLGGSLSIPHGWEDLAAFV
jgi:hypothetical protein